MSGPESSLPSPLTVPMATGSSVAADGGSLPKTSTWPRKVEVEWGTVAVDGGVLDCELNCAERGELASGIENGPLCPSALQRAPLASSDASC